MARGRKASLVVVRFPERQLLAIVRRTKSVVDVRVWNSVSAVSSGSSNCFRRPEKYSAVWPWVCRKTGCVEVTVNLRSNSPLAVDVEHNGVLISQIPGDGLRDLHVVRFVRWGPVPTDSAGSVTISNYWISSAGTIEHICFTSRGFDCSKKRPVQPIRVAASIATM